MMLQHFDNIWKPTSLMNFGYLKDIWRILP